MTREVAHFQMFEAALETIQPNFPPGILQSDPRHSNTYFNMSDGKEVRGPWNEGKSPQFAEDWQYIDKPLEHVRETDGLLAREPEGTVRTEKEVQKLNKSLSKERSKEINSANKPVEGEIQWSEYQPAV
jgi:Mn-containing catalase